MPARVKEVSERFKANLGPETRAGNDYTVKRSLRLVNFTFLDALSDFKYRPTMHAGTVLTDVPLSERCVWVTGVHHDFGLVEKPAPKQHLKPIPYHNGTFPKSRACQFSTRSKTLAHFLSSRSEYVAPHEKQLLDDPRLRCDGCLIGFPVTEDAPINISLRNIMIATVVS